MFTVCPKCALTLVVTAADLRVAQGYVRCGRCLNVFNALARLSEERPSAAPPPETTASGAPEQPPGPTQDPAPSPQIEDAADDTGEIDFELDASLLVTSTRLAAPEGAAAQPEDRAEHEDRLEHGDRLEPEDGAEHPGTAGSEGAVGTQSVAHSSGPATEERAPARAVAEAAYGEPHESSPGELAAASARPSEVAPEQTAEVSPASETSPTSEVSAASEISAASEASPPSEGAPLTDAPSPARAPDAQQTNTEQQQPESAFELEARRPRAGLAWRIGAGALTLALALQIVNHYRDALAANPALRGPLSSIYSALGVKLAPRWNIQAYDVRQLGASVAGAATGEIVVRASVKNGASRAQPLPLLRVTLQDRFGNRIAARDVPPGDYLPSPVAPGALLAAGSRVDATMTFVDPGPQAVGFEIDACLPQRNGAVACAHGP